MASRMSMVAGGRRRRDFPRQGIGGPAIGTVLPGLAAAAAVVLLTACGSAGTGGTGGGGGGAAHRPTAAHGTVVSARKLPGVGTVLVSRSGKTLYSPQQEVHGKIMCTGSCLSFWFPVRATAGTTLRAPGGVTGALGTILRPGGLTQLTYNGKPLYTFRLDQAPGQAHGNDFTDHFGGVSFTWHAVTANGSPAGADQPGNGGGYANQGSPPGY